MVAMIDVGCLLTFGVLFVSVSEAFQTDRAKTATVQSLLVGVFLSTGLLSGALITRLGLPLAVLIASFLTPAGFCVSFFAGSIYFLYISIGIVAGLGLSMVFVSSVVLIERIFTGKQKLVCLSILQAAIAAYTMVHPYILIWLNELFGLRGTFLINGGLSLNTFAFFLICWFENEVGDTEKQRSERVTDTLVESNGVEDMEAKQKRVNENKKLISKNLNRSPFFILKNMMTKQYVCLLLGTSVCLITFNGFIGLMLDIALWKGLNHSEGLSSFLFFSIFAVVSRLIPGLLKTRKGISSFMYPTICTIFGCIGQVLVCFANDRVVFLTGSAFTGLAFGGVLASSINIVVKIMPSEQVAMACGLLTTARGIFTAAAGPVFGTIREKSGSYYIVIVAICLAQALATCLFTLALVLRRNDRRNRRIPDSPEVQ